MNFETIVKKQEQIEVLNHELKNAICTIKKLLSISNLDSETLAIYENEVKIHKSKLI